MTNKILLLNLLSLFILYFVQGMPYGLQSRYIPIIMRLNGVSLSELGLLKLLLIPWILKFFIAAFLIDIYKTKRFWLMTSLSLLSLGSFLCSIFTEYYKIAILMFILNLASSVQDICVDWFAINVLDKEDLGIGNTIQVAGYKAGTLFTGGIIVWLIDYIDLSRAFFILGFIYLISLLLLNVSLFNVENKKLNNIQQKKHDNADHAQMVPLKTRLNMIFMEVPGTFWMCIFVIVYKLGEQSSLNMFPLYLLDHKVESSKIGLWTGVLGQVFSITGSILSGICLKKTHNRISSYKWLDYTIKLRLIPIFIITFIINIQNETQNLNDNSFILYLLFSTALFQLFLSGFLTTITFTLMMEISLNAPNLIQATHYSLLATFEILGKLLFQPLVSVYTDVYGYKYAFILFSILYSICLIIIKFLIKK